MAKAPFLAGTQALFGPCLLHHQRDKLLKGQRCLGKAFERDSFEYLGASDDQPRARLGRQMQGHALAGQGLPDIVIFQIDAHRAMAIDRAHHRQAVAHLQPAIRIDDVGDRWQLWQDGKGGAWGTVVTTEPLVGTLIVVVLHKLRGDGPHLLQGRRTLPGQALCLIAAMIAFHKAVGRSRQLHRLHL